MRFVLRRQLLQRRFEAARNHHRHILRKRARAEGGEGQGGNHRSECKHEGSLLNGSLQD
ncbi:hypothetical protein [Enterobacter hormaechei]|nr:hypothetical protein [Enterobacter hormaechei]